MLFPFVGGASLWFLLAVGPVLLGVFRLARIWVLGQTVIRVQRETGGSAQDSSKALARVLHADGARRQPRSVTLPQNDSSTKEYLDVQVADEGPG